MAGKLAADIKQSKPFEHIEAEAVLNIARTADALCQKEAALFEAHGLTPAQYNVLRILRGAGADGLSCGDVADRMIQRDPDITRLIDRLERNGLAQRSRDSKDRRVVMLRILRAGLDLLAVVDEPLVALHETLLGHMTKKELRTLIELLEKARENA